jgi:hypothetical protein
METETRDVSSKPGQLKLELGCHASNPRMWPTYLGLYAFQHSIVYLNHHRIELLCMIWFRRLPWWMSLKAAVTEGFMWAGHILE